MVSPIAAANMARYRGGGVSYQLPIGMRRTAPVVRRGAAPAGGQPRSLAQIARNDEAFSRWAAEGAAPSGGGGALGGLGWMIGKGLAGGMQALSVLDYPRAAVVGGIRQTLDTEMMEDLNRALAKLPGVEYSPIANPDYDPGWDWGELWSDIKKHEGFGTSIVEPAMGEHGTDRGRGWRIAAGFAGDVFADPLTYTGMGVGAQAGKAERASRLRKLVTAQDDLAKLIAEQGDNVAADLLKQQARLGDMSAVERLGSRGLSTANREQLAAMGLERNALRWGGPRGLRIPGTETMSRGLAEGLGALRPVARAVPGAGLIRQAATRKGYLGQDLLPSFERVITGKGRMSMREALDTLATNEMERLAGGGFEGRANAALRVLSRKARAMSESVVDDEVHAAETGIDNMWSKFAEDMRIAATQVGGEIPEFKPITLPDGRVLRFAVPHVLTRPFRDFLESGQGTKEVDDFMRAAGLTTDDLLEESGFLQRRTFRPKEDGTPDVFKIGDQELTVEEGSLRELESKLRSMFPEYDGPIYEKSPVEAWRRYIQGVKRDVAKRSAFRQAAKRGFSHVEELHEKPPDYDPYGGRETVTIGGDEATEAERVIPNPEVKPTDPHWKMVPDAQATKERNRAIGTAKRGPQADILDSYETFSRAERGRIAAEIDAAAEQLLKPVRTRRAELLQREIVARSKVTTAAERVEVFDKLRPQIEAEIDRLADEMRRVKAAIKRVQRTADQRTKREQSRLLKALQERYGQLTEQNERLTAAYHDALAKIDARAGMENVVDLPTERQIRDYPRKRMAQERHALAYGDEKRAGESKLRNIRDKKKRDYIKGRRAKGSWVEDAEYDKAEATIRRADKSGELRRYRDMVERQSKHERDGARAYADALDLDTEISRLDRDIQRLQREAGRDVSDEMLRTAERADELDMQVDELQRQLDESVQLGNKQQADAVRKQLDHYKHEAQRMRTKLDRATPGEQAEAIESMLSDKRRMRAEADALRARGENDLEQSQRLKERIDNHKLTAAADIRKRYNTAQEELARHIQGEEQQWQAAKRQLDDFDQAAAEEARRGEIAAAPKPVKLDRADQVRLGRARRILGSERISTYVRNSERAAELASMLEGAGKPSQVPGRVADEARAQIETIGRGLDGDGNRLGAREELRRLERQHEVYEQSAKVAKGQEPDARQLRQAAARDEAAAEIATRKKQIAEAEARLTELRKSVEGPPQIPPRKEIKLRRELERLTKYLDDNKPLAEHARQAQSVVDELEQKLARLQPAAAERARRLPFFENLDREVAEMRGRLDARERLPKIQRAQEQLKRVPQIEAVRSELQDVTQQLRQVGSDTGPLAENVLREGTTAMEKTRLLRDQAERAARQTAEYQGALDRIDNQAGRARETYRMAQNDLDKARAETQAVADKMSGVNAAPERAASMVETTKREAKAAATRLELVSKGLMPSYEAQPMHRVINDLDKLVAANPLGNDDAMHKMESVLHSLRGQLSELTEKTDLPARQTRQIIKQANNGELAPVLTAQVADAMKLLWDEGDIVVRRDAMKMYLNIREGVQSNLFGRLLTTWTNFFKTYATLSPGFHIRNALTAMFMNWTEGVTTREQFKAMRLWREFRHQDDPIGWLGKLKETDEAAYNAFDAAFASGTGGQFFEAGVGEMANVRGRIKEGIFANRLTRGSQRFGQDWVEGPQRLALALHSTRNGGTTVDALQAITRIHFDYSQVSSFDEQAKRIIPFWTFTSRNIPLQFTQMWMRPKMYLRYQSLVRNFQNTEGLPEFTPEYMVNAGAFNTGLTTPGWLPGADEGVPILAQPDLPHLRLQEDIMRMTAPLRGENMGQALSDVNPIFTAPFEYMLGEDFYTGQQYDVDDVSQTTKLGAPLAAVASIFGAGRRGANGEWYIDDKAMNLLNTLLPPLERQSRLVPGLLTSGGDQGKNQRLAESYARFWLGAPVRTLSEKQQQSEQRNRYYEAIEQAKRLAATGG